MIYFDNAATTFPKPDAVYNEVKRCMTEYCGNPGRGSHKLSIAASEKIYECRCQIAEFFHSDYPENVVFTYNTTYALNLAIKTLLAPNSHVLYSDIDHNAVYRPICALESYGIEHNSFKTYESGMIQNYDFNQMTLKSIRNGIRDNTRVLIASHCSNICGIRLPLEKIGTLCREYGIIFIVDAAQSAGYYDIDMKKCNIAALCAPGHKGLYGIQGCGFTIYAPEYNKPEFLKNNTFIEGGSGINSLDTEMPDMLPEHFEAGTLSTPAIAGLCEGIKYIKEIGIEEIRMHEHKLYRRLKEMMMNTNGVTVYANDIRESSILLFNVNNKSSNAVSDALDKEDIYVRSGFHCTPLGHKLLETGDNGAVRVSFGMYNTMAEIEQFYKVLKTII